MNKTSQAGSKVSFDIRCIFLTTCSLMHFSLLIMTVLVLQVYVHHEYTCEKEKIKTFNIQLKYPKFYEDFNLL